MIPFKRMEMDSGWCPGFPKNSPWMPWIDVVRIACIPVEEAEDPFGSDDSCVKMDRNG